MLYKVSTPRTDMRFEPSKFWHTADWKSSSNTSKPGYVEDVVLYAAGFDEVNIHLLPRVRRLRVPIMPDTAESLQNMGFEWGVDCRALIFVGLEHRETVEGFCPTIFTFQEDGFEPIPSNEFIARETRIATTCETITMREAVARWHIEIAYVNDIDAIRDEIRRRELPYSEQT